MDNLTHYLATTLRTLRHQRGWSLSRLAEISGVSKAMLGQIERNESSPTVATLWKIATGLNVPFSMFISPPQAEFPPTFDPQQQAMVITPLFPWDPELCFDYFSLLLAPGAVSAQRRGKRKLRQQSVGFVIQSRCVTARVVNPLDNSLGGV